MMASKRRVRKDSSSFGEFVSFEDKAADKLIDKGGSADGFLLVSYRTVDCYDEKNRKSLPTVA